MSMRGSKRATGSRPEDQPGPSGLSAGPSGAPSSSKRRRTEPEDAQWHLRQANDLKMSSIYNRSATEAPAELFRKDLISAMKLPDNEPLTPSEYWVITDPWKQDWERGVQVPVNPDSLPAPKVKIIENPKPPDHTAFKLPKDKYIHLTRDSNYQSDKHQLSSTPASAEAACSYDLDATDTSWLKLLNAERARAGAAPITEEQLEKVIEELEVRTWDKIQAIIKSEEGLGIEYDENVICDVCRSPDSEDGNEMVFCDSCNICVHQACYGITVIPDGQWLCRPCGDTVKPNCVLCPNLGGAMKCTPSGHKWAHVSCVLWIPEVSIGCAEKMEPITKISSIPSSRWSLVCVLCRERKGACIQCSVKSCKTAYHVTCAFRHGLEMRAIIEDENADDGVKLRSYCQKHSVNSKKAKVPGSGSEEEEVKKKRRKDMTSEEKTQARTARLHEIEKEFDKHVSVKDISSHLLDVDQDAINYIYHYWKLKRRSSHNRPLLPPKSDDNDLMSHRQEQADLDKMKMFVQLRQDLERVRNLCYMVSRREKLSRSFFRQREQTFHKQVGVLSSGLEIPKEEMNAIVEANHGPSIYDRLYSHAGAADHKTNFEALLAKIAPHRADSSDDRKKDRNGLARRSKANPYKKHYVNGSRRSGSGISGISSEESESEITRTNKYRNRAIGSSTDDTGDPKKKNSTSPNKKVSPKAKAKKIQKSPKKNDNARKKKKVPQSKALVESSTEDDSPTRNSNRDLSGDTPSSSKRDKSAGTSTASKKEVEPSTSGISKKDKFQVPSVSGTSKRDRLPSISGVIKKEKDPIPSTSGIIKKEKDLTNSSGVLKGDRMPSISGILKKEKEPTPSTSGIKKEPIPSTSVAFKKDKETMPGTSRTSKKDNPVSKTLRQMEKEMAAAGRHGKSGSDSDDLDLVPIRIAKSVKFPIDIYSTSSDESSNGRIEIKLEKGEKSASDKSPSGNDSQQSFRTKAAMKEFVHADKKEQQEEGKPPPKKRGRKPFNKDKKPQVAAKTQVSEDESRSKVSKHSKQQNDHPGIVPQRQAAKKASENIRSTTSGKKEETGAPERPLEDPKGKGKGKGKGKEMRSPPARIARKLSKDDKDTIAYVPQRQAAKKAAAHIKNIGSKVPVPECAESNNKKKDDKNDSKSSDENKKKSASKESSSSSSSSSCSSSCSSSSDEADKPAAPGPKPAAKAREIKPVSMFSPPGSRPILDLPFLDKVSRPLSSTSASSDTESSHSERSGSTSPTPKRPRRRRKGKSTSNDVSPRKAPDKKLKTSELESECGVPSAAAQGEEPGGAVRVGPRGIVAGGNLPHLVDSRLRESADAAFAAQHAEEDQPPQLPSAERKTDEEAVKKVTKTCTMEGHDHENIPLPPNEPPIDTKPKMTLKLDKVAVKTELDSPKRVPEPKQKIISNRRASVMEPAAKETTEFQPPLPDEEPRELIKQRRQSRYEYQNSLLTRTIGAPAKKSSLLLEPPPPPPPLPPPVIEDKKSAMVPNEDNSDNNKPCVTQVPNPTVGPPQNERSGDNDKCMADDKSSGTECTEKSSVKMIAKIQANLNENTMIKSPRTPMDARSIAIDSIDSENPNAKNMKKRSAIDIAQNASQIQGVEISKSAKIPSTVNPYPNRSMFSPQQKDNELFAFDMMAVDDGFNHDDDLMKPFSSYPEFFFKEDSKEQGVQETLNLVDRLRMQLSSKKIPTENASQEHAVPMNDLNDHREQERMREAHQIEMNQKRNEAMDMVLPLSAPMPPEHNDLTLHPHPHPHPYPHPHPQPHTHPLPHPLQHPHLHPDLSRSLLMQENDYHHPIPMTSNDKWAPMPLVHNDPYMEQDQRSYDNNEQYMEEIKEPSTVQSDLQSGDTTSLSKQSDDSSQPSVVIVDNSTTTTTIIDVETTQDTPTFDNNNLIMHGDSSYISQEKWRESKIATRRSSGSSSSSGTGAGAVERSRSLLAAHMEMRDAMLAPPPAVLPEIDSYPPIPAYSCPVEPSMPLNQYATYPPSASPFLSRMGSLFGAGACPQLPLPSPSPLFASGLSYSSAQLLPRQLCAAAFTSSSQNIALTTAMIAPPTPKPLDSPNTDIDVTESDKFSIHVASSSSSVSVGSYENSRAAKDSNDSSEPGPGILLQNSSQSSQKSPPKSGGQPPKASLKYPGKSPGKSPGISPRQGENPHKPAKRPSSKTSNRSTRGRGRSKSRNSSGQAYSVDYLGNSIHNKLVGTVYDFDEELANDSVDLKALRDRRKSIDLREDRRLEHSFKDMSRSPHLLSPQHLSKRLPPMEGDSPPGSLAFSHVVPLLPGPVDMRTYHSFEAPPPPPPFAPHHLAAPEREPEPERLLPPQALPVPMPFPFPAPEPPKDTYTPQLPKVSLSDSRNQLKVKIKGPFLDANYSSSVPTVVVPPPVPTFETPISVFNASAMAASCMSGSTNLRRMRKKELLRQYWTQDMNMDDPTGAAMMGAVPPVAQPSPLSRAVITIPKAVASMTSIPTREDYKITDPPVEPKKKQKQKRKVSSGLSRELRHLKVTMNDDLDPSDDVKLSSFVTAPPVQAKKRARPAKPAKVPDAPSAQLAPKLKIKLGSNTVQQVTEEPSALRPPKKRMQPQPSFEDLRRESMKFRKLVMADFEETEKTTQKQKLSKSEKRKKKKEKKALKKKALTSEGDNGTKLVIKIKLPVAPGEEANAEDDAEVAEEGGAEVEAAGAAAAAAAAAVPEPIVDPIDHYDPSAPDPLAIDTPSYAETTTAMRKVRTAKVTPIRLKLARSTKGTSYVMQNEDGAGPSSAPDTTSASPDAPDKHSDVR